MREDNIISINSGTIIRAILIVIGFIAAFYLHSVLLVVILSIVTASAIEPGTRWLTRKNVPRLLSVILMYLILAMLFICILYFLLLPILSETANFLSSLPSYLGDLKVWDPLSSDGELSNSGISAISQNFSLVDMVNQLDVTIQNFSKGFFSTASSV